MRAFMKKMLVALVFGMLLATAGAANEPTFTRTEDAIYGRKFGTALTMDVFTPVKGANGAAVILVISGGWVSSHEFVEPDVAKIYTDRGYTVFEVVHGSQPKYTVAEILDDMHRAVRFIRHNAKDYQIDPDRIGITGSSAGGHLALMIGTSGKLGDSTAKDAVDRTSSRVQAVACFFPPTDLLNYGEKGNIRDSLPDMRAVFDFHELDKKTQSFVPIIDERRTLAIFRELSPINHVSADAPPTLIIHGDADQRVPIQQSERMIAKLKEAGATAELVVKKGARHGWKESEKDLATFADWFDRYLTKAPKTNIPSNGIRQEK